MSREKVNCFKHGIVYFSNEKTDELAKAIKVLTNKKQELEDEVEQLEDDLETLTEQLKIESDIGANEVFAKIAVEKAKKYQEEQDKEFIEYMKRN